MVNGVLLGESQQNAEICKAHTPAATFAYLFERKKKGKKNYYSNIERTPRDIEPF